MCVCVCKTSRVGFGSDSNLIIQSRLYQTIPSGRVNWQSGILFVWVCMLMSNPSKTNACVCPLHAYVLVLSGASDGNLHSNGLLPDGKYACGHVHALLWSQSLGALRTQWGTDRMIIAFHGLSLSSPPQIHRQEIEIIPTIQLSHERLGRKKSARHSST